MAELPVPIVGALPGPAIGGGAELALACDMRVADVRAKISFKQVRMGVTTAWGTAARLVALVGAGAAARLLYTSHEIAGDEAKLIGLVDEVTAIGLARATALAWASDIAEGSPRAIAEMKRLLRETTKASAGDVRAIERQSFVATWSSADHPEAVEAYFERRTPRWEDR
jgi:enoyl-CoA hydratase/carnithine racemase